MIIAMMVLALCFLLGAFISLRRAPKSPENFEKTSNIATKQVGRDYSREEVALHNRRSDCWIILKGKVYDVTSYVEEHPGGDAILNNAGDDSTNGFFGPQHGTRVFDIIEDFYVGDLKT